EELVDRVTLDVGGRDAEGLLELAEGRDVVAEDRFPRVVDDAPEARNAHRGRGAEGEAGLVLGMFGQLAELRELGDRGDARSGSATVMAVVHGVNERTVSPKASTKIVRATLSRSPGRSDVVRKPVARAAIGTNAGAPVRRSAAIASAWAS